MFERNKPKNKQPKPSTKDAGKKEEKVDIYYKRDGKPTVARDVKSDDIEKFMAALSDTDGKITKLKVISNDKKEK